MARLRRPEPVEVADTAIPSELLDPDAAVWHDQRRYLAYMAERGWSLPAAERFGCSTHPGNRRSAAAEGWGAENGITTTPGHADWHRLRAIGVL